MPRLIDRLREKAAAGRPIVGAVSGRGEADFLAVHTSARFPGRLSGMLPLGDANAIVLELAGEAVRAAGGTPVLAGLCGADPMRSLERFLDDVRAAGFSGVQNWPTVGLIDGAFRRSLEETELGYAREVELVRTASRAGLFTAPFVFTPDEAERMLEAGADLLVAHPGLAESNALSRIEAVAAAARAFRKDALVLSFGLEPGFVKGVQGVFRP